MRRRTYTLKICITGTPDIHSGWITDYTDSKKYRSIPLSICSIINYSLNPRLRKPTSEQLSIWLWNKTKPIFPGLTRIALSETPTSGVVYEGEHHTIENKQDISIAKDKTRADEREIQ